MAYNSDLDVFFFKPEGAYGSPETLAMADMVVLTGEANWQPKVANWQQRDITNGQLGSQPEYAGSQHSAIGLPVELAGGGAAGSAPQWAALAEACGFSMTTTPSTSVAFDPVSGGYSSGTGLYNTDGLDQVMAGARGNAVISFKAEEVPKIEFSMISRFAIPTEKAAPSGSLPTIIEGVPFNNANTTVTLGGTDMAAEEISINCGRSPVFRDISNVNETRILSRKITGSMTVELPALSAKNLFQECEANTLQTLKIVHGTAAGNTIEIDGPKVQVKTQDPGNATGVITMPLALIFTPDSTDDELKITVK